MSRKTPPSRRLHHLFRAAGVGATHHAGKRIPRSWASFCQLAASAKPRRKRAPASIADRRASAARTLESELKFIALEIRNKRTNILHTPSRRSWAELDRRRIATGFNPGPPRRPAYRNQRGDRR